MFEKVDFYKRYLDLNEQEDGDILHILQSMLQSMNIEVDTSKGIVLKNDDTVVLRVPNASGEIVQIVCRKVKQ